MIKSLSYEAFAAIYRERITVDFPRGERRPLRMIRKLYRQGRYVCLVLEEDQVLAYATFIFDHKINSVFLEYFAVEERQRGGGIGGRFLSMLQQYWSGKSGMILECERPDAASSSEEKALRQRRIAFYQRNGAQILSWQWRAFGVEYLLLWLPTGQTSDPGDIPHDLLTLYCFSMPALFRLLFLRLRSANLEEPDKEA